MQELLKNEVYLVVPCELYEYAAMRELNFMLSPYIITKHQDLRNLNVIRYKTYLKFRDNYASKKVIECADKGEIDKVFDAIIAEFFTEDDIKIYDEHVEKTRKNAEIFMRLVDNLIDE